MTQAEIADQRAEWRERIAGVADILRAESDANEELRQLSPEGEAEQARALASGT